MQEARDLLTAAEVADMLRIHRVTVMRMRKDGSLPAVEFHGNFRYRREDVVKLLEPKTYGGEPA